jgi:DNA-binding transcriptional LysR family regulator
MTHEHLTPSPFQSWDDLRFFLVTTQKGSLAKAASHIGVTQPTVSRRIESLEERLGVRLFDRLPSGVTLTVEGESILDAAKLIEKKVLEIQMNVSGLDKRLEGKVRVSVTDGFAAYWITPRLHTFQELYPGISFDMLCSVEPTDALKWETDIRIQFSRPSDADLIAARVATFHFIPWASPTYLARRGIPQNAEDLKHHRLLDHLAYHYDGGDWSAWHNIADVAKQVCYRTNSSAALLSAVQNSLGIALLPTYATDCVTGVIPLDIGVRTRSDVWLSYHPALRDTPRFRAAVEWIKGLFDKNLWVWFRDEFHSPGHPGQPTEPKRIKATTR